MLYSPQPLWIFELCGFDRLLGNHCHHDQRGGLTLE
jgi:hypothetical protein